MRPGTQAVGASGEYRGMRRLFPLLTASVFVVLLAATAATAGRSNRDPGVRTAQVGACPASTKPSDTPGNGNGGGQGNPAGGNPAGSNPATGNGGGQGNPAGGNPAGGNGGGQGNPAGGNPAGGNGNTGSNAGGNGNGNAGGNSQGNSNAGGNGNSGGHGQGSGSSNAGGNGDGASAGNGPGNGNAGGNGQGSGSDAGCVDPPADPAPGAVAGDGTLPVAEAGKSVNVEPVAGVVGVQRPGSNGFEPLGASAHLPEGTVLDTRAGTVELTTDDAKNGQQTAAFTGAKFEVRQEKAKAAVTELVLHGGDFANCPRLDHGRRVQAIRNGVIAARGTSGRRLWGNGHGRFRTRGRWGSATVRGTIWQVEDRCDGTLTTVARGVVEVNDFGLGRTVSVKAGQQYFAKVRP